MRLDLGLLNRSCPTNKVGTTLRYPKLEIKPSNSATICHLTPQTLATTN